MDENQPTGEAKPASRKYFTRGSGGRSDGTCGFGYFLGAIASAVYFLQRIDGFWPGVVAILKALVWPAFLIYKVFQLLNI